LLYRAPFILSTAEFSEISVTVQMQSNHDTEMLIDLRIGQNSPSACRHLASFILSSESDCFKLHQSEFSHLEISSGSGTEVDYDNTSHASHESFIFLRPTLEFSSTPRSASIHNRHQEEPVPRTFTHIYSYPRTFDTGTLPPPPPRRFYRTFWRSLVRRAVQQTAHPT
jgi:hypothetical protein